MTLPMATVPWRRGGRLSPAIWCPRLSGLGPPESAGTTAIPSPPRAEVTGKQGAEASQRKWSQGRTVHTCPGAEKRTATWPTEGGGSNTASPSETSLGLLQWGWSIPECSL